MQCINKLYLSCFWVSSKEPYSSLKTESLRDLSWLIAPQFVIMTTCRGCHIYNLWCHQWWQIWRQVDFRWFYFTASHNVYTRACFDLTYWGLDKTDVISQTTFSNAFSLVKMYECRLRFHWSLFLMFELTIFHQMTSHYLNQWWLVYWRIFALGLNKLIYFGYVTSSWWFLCWSHPHSSGNFVGNDNRHTCEVILKDMGKIDQYK